MCGIAGFVDFKGAHSAAGAAALAKAMGDAIRHRGPDASGEWVDRDAVLALAHRRLSIQDLSTAGQQPMLSASGRFVLVFNGEIYNFRELRRELDTKIATDWRSTGDTEVLLRLIEQHGLPAALELTTGMFALACFDVQQRKLFLARDRVGKKPFYYSLNDQGFVFGSELKAIIPHPAVSRRVDPAAVDEFLRRGYIQAPNCIFRNCRKLLPGTYAELDIDAGPDSFRINTYWDIQKVAEEGTDSRQQDSYDVEKLRWLIDDAVKQRLVADVELGMLLSGGIDSSLIVSSSVCAKTAASVKTFTVGFEDPRFDESVNASNIAHYLGTEHYESRLNPHDALSIIPELPGIYDEPFGDASQLPTVLVCRKAREHVKVALSGDGGDEFFHGYSRYARKMAQWDRIRSWPRFLRGPLGAATHTMGALALQCAPTGLLPGKRWYDLARAGQFAQASSLAAAYQLGVSAWTLRDSFLRDEYGIHTHSHHAEPGFLGESVSALAMVDQQSYLPDDILCKVDRASMAVGLEMRAPLLDHRLIEFAWTIPAQCMSDGQRGKLPLWNIVKDRVPLAYLDRPKQGFGVPLNDWLKGPLHEWAAELLSKDSIASRGILDPARVARIWAAFSAGQENLVSIVWNILVFEQWASRYEAEA